MRIRWQTVLQTAFILVLIPLGISFFSHSAEELVDVTHQLQRAEPLYLLAALICMACFIAAKSVALQCAYASLEKEVAFGKAVRLYLRRFFISPFIPGGFTAAQFTLTRDLAHLKMSRAEHVFVSAMYVTATVASYSILLTLVAIFAVPIIFRDNIPLINILMPIGALIGTVILMAFLFRKVIAAKVRTAIKPHIEHFHSKPLLKAVAASFFVEVFGIYLLWISIHVIGVQAQISFPLVAAVYILTMMVVMAAPLFQGLVLVEGALIFLLSRIGIPLSSALAIALVFRGFQLWMPVLAGGVVHFIHYARHAHERMQRVIKEN
jgi:phosphatidylglycerol lysyltransferase